MRKKYIYESLDGGKTIYRCEDDNHASEESIVVNVDKEYWTTTKFKNIEIEYINSEEK